MYILQCSDKSYYTGSTTDLERRLEEHQMGIGANYTCDRLPVALVYFEEFDRIDEAFFREKQVQGWSRKIKEALIFGCSERLNKLSECKNETHFLRISTLINHASTSLSDRNIASDLLSDRSIDSTSLSEHDIDSASLSDRIISIEGKSTPRSMSEVEVQNCST